MLRRFGRANKQCPLRVKKRGKVTAKGGRRVKEARGGTP